MNPRQLIAVLLFAAPAVASEPIELTVDEFKMYRHYLDAMEDPRVQKMKPDARMPAIARDAKYKLPALKSAIEKAEAAGDIKGKCEGNIKEALSKGAVAGRVSKVDVDVSAPHAVAYVQWLNEDLAKIAVEACTTAALAQSGCPIVSTITIWAQDKAKQDMRVFEGIISSASASRIAVDKAKDFAETRYLRLFEKMKNAAKGDDLSASSGTPAAK
jgi:hypothetical protein